MTTPPPLNPEPEPISSKVAVRVIENKVIPPTKPRSIFSQIVFGPRLTWTLFRLLLITLAFYVFWNHYFPVQITGPSMEPTYPDRSWNLIDRKAYNENHLPQRGDVVAIEARSGDAVFLKRIIGLPGERISFLQNQVIIDGLPLSEPYVILKPKSRRHAWNRLPTPLSEDEYFVVGDNRSMPINHHTHGATRRHRILGKIVF